MTMSIHPDTNKNRLRKCFREALALAPDYAIDTLAYRSHAAWDSVGHMRLIAALETEFSVMLTTDQIIDLSSFDKACSILAHHGVTVDA